MTAVQYCDQKAGDIADTLLAHYHVNARELPWRAPPGSKLPDPYHVWLSEIMLQQTTVAAVIPYFFKFISRWPDFAALAAADHSDVMAAWAGLGYYARARNLIACAKLVASSYAGNLPATEAELLKLPGVGPYTAAAIAAIAFGARAVVVDANVERVISRLFAIGTPLPAGKAEIRAAADIITPNAKAGDFAQAMMDLGASLCSVRNPSCLLCPIQTHCAAAQASNAELYPFKAAKRTKLHRTGTAYWVERDDAVWLITRGGKGMLAGMRALPDDGWSVQQDGSGIAPFDAEWHLLPQPVVHAFTHFTLSLKIAVTASVPADAKAGNGGYWPIKSLDKAGLPTLFNKAAQAALSAGER